MRKTTVVSGTSRVTGKRPLPPWAWTTVGGLAVPLWATWPALSLQTHEIPPFECLGFVFFVAWAAVIPLERAVMPINSGAVNKQAWIPAAAFGLAETGSTAFFLFATRYIAAAEANLIVYLWPAIVVLLGASLRLFRLELRHLMGLALGFAGVAILIGFDQLSTSLAGMTLSLLAGLSWALYCVVRLKWRGNAGPFLARGFGIAALLCGAMHLVLEPSVRPSLKVLAATAAAGLLPTAIANVAWDEGFKKGDSQLLTVMAYATPLFSALFLVALRVESITWRLLVGAIVIVAAAVMSRR